MGALQNNQTETEHQGFMWKQWQKNDHYFDFWITGSKTKFDIKESILNFHLVYFRVRRKTFF